MSSQPFDVLALLRDPHYDQRPVSDFDRAAKIVANLIEGAQLLNSCPHADLGDIVHAIRERELQGWDGPAVTQWSNGVTKLRAALASIASAS